MEKGPIFIGGEGRSGTTLMRVILDSHKNIACGPETHLFIEQELENLYNLLLDKYDYRIKEYYPDHERALADCFSAMISKFHEPYMISQGKKRWADKTPLNILRIEFFNKLFPDMKFIHMVRDGRDVAVSILGMPWGPDSIEGIAQRWVSCIESGRAFSAQHENYLEVRYESLVQEFEPTVRSVLSFLEEEWDPDVLNYYNKKHDFGNQFAKESSADQVKEPIYQNKIGRWKRELTEAQITAFDRIAGKTLEELGYER